MFLRRKIIFKKVPKTINDNKNFHLINANHISVYYIFEGNVHTIYNLWLVEVKRICSRYMDTLNFTYPHHNILFEIYIFL